VEEHNDWDWNSTYWRNLGSPWGGAHSTAADVGRFLRYFAHPTSGPLKEATVAGMITNQNQGLNTPWGIGWSMGRGFGKHSSPKTFGHSGTTGTLCWMDPEKMSLRAVTTKPSAVSGRSC
jgi:CubicO group peptidase (beta-lactamase class C family)